MRRFGRKLDVESLRAEQALQPFWFDLLYLNGGSLHGRVAGPAFCDACGKLAGESALTPNHHRP